MSPTYVGHRPAVELSDRCAQCGSQVSPSFVRVLGDERGEVYGCPSCQ